MLIATTRWIQFFRLCPWGKSHQEYGPVRHEARYREKCATFRCLSSLGRIAYQFLHVGIPPYGGRYSYQWGIGSAAILPYPELR